MSRHRLNFAGALTHPTVWLLAIIMFCCQTGSYGLTLWVPTIVKGLSGFTNLEVGMFSAVPYIAAALGMIFIGRSSDRSGERFMHLAIPTAIGAVGFVATAICKSPLPAMIAISVAAVGDYGTRGPFWALPGKFLSGRWRGRRHRTDQFLRGDRRLRRTVHGGLFKDATGSFESRSIYWRESWSWVRC